MIHIFSKTLYPAADYLGLAGLTKWILSDIIVGSRLSYENMEEILLHFQKYDLDKIIEKEILSDLKANWQDYVEDFPNGWKFLFKVWPDFNRSIHITSYDHLTQLMRAVDELDEDQFAKVDTFVLMEGSVQWVIMEKDPILFFRFRTKFCSDRLIGWIESLFLDLTDLQDTDKIIR